MDHNETLQAIKEFIIKRENATGENFDPDKTEISAAIDLENGYQTRAFLTKIGDG